MQRTDIASGLGNGLQIVKYTVTFSDLTAAATSQTLFPDTDPGGNPLATPATTAPPNARNFQIPQAAYINYVKIHHTTPFSGGTIASMTVSVGKLGGSNTFVAPAFNVFQAASDTTLQETFSVSSGQISAWGITFTFTSTVGNVVAATAGSVDIYIAYANVSSPTE